MQLERLVHTIASSLLLYMITKSLAYIFTTKPKIEDIHPPYVSALVSLTSTRGRGGCFAFRHEVVHLLSMVHVSEFADYFNLIPHVSTCHANLLDLADANSSPYDVCP